MHTRPSNVRCQSSGQHGLPPCLRHTLDPGLPTCPAQQQPQQLGRTVLRPGPAAADPVQGAAAEGLLCPGATAADAVQLWAGRPGGPVGHVHAVGGGPQGYAAPGGRRAGGVHDRAVARGCADVPGGYLGVTSAHASRTRITCSISITTHTSTAHAWRRMLGCACPVACLRRGWCYSGKHAHSLISPVPTQKGQITQLC